MIIGMDSSSREVEAVEMRPRLRQALGSDLTAIHQGIDVALRLGFLQAILRDHLRDKIILVLERGQLVLGEFAPFGADLLENDLLGLSSGRRMSCGRVQV